MSNLSPKALSAFASLATPAANNRFSSNEKFGAMFAEAQVKSRKAAHEAIVAELTGVATAMDDRQLQLAQTAVALRRQADQADAAVTAISTAFAYGESTDNYLPLLSILEIVSVGDYATVGLTRAEWEELITIPESYTPPVAA
jgi:hypothetical protein